MKHSCPVEGGGFRTSAEHGVMVGKIQDRLLQPVNYSPAKGQAMLAASD
jgi:hypothetical protein